MRGNHAIEIAASRPAALCNDPAIGHGRGGIKRQNRQAAQQDVQSDLPNTRKPGIAVQSTLQFGKA